jgi:dolichol-phosphate mannosyltransferase
VRVSFVIPCYQEAAALDAGLASLLALTADELVFVDDGSTDGTAARLAAAAARDPRVRVVTHARNRGVGAAMRSGFAAATGDVVVAYDADRTYPAADAARLVAAVRAGADVATATPFAPGGVVRTTFLRGLLSRGASFAYRLAVGPRAGDVRTFTGGFRAYRRAVVATTPFRSDGFASTAELLCLLLLGGAKVVEVPSTLSARTEGVSKMRVGRTILGHVRVLARVANARLGGKMTSP